MSESYPCANFMGLYKSGSTTREFTCPCGTSVQLSELFIQKWLLYLNFKFTTIGFATQGIGHHISFARGRGNIHVEVGYCLEPSLLAEIQVWLSKQILQTLVVGVDLATITDEVMSPQL